MSFNSLGYFIFLPLVVGIYHVLGLRAQNLWLLGASYFFYGCFDPRFLTLIALSSLIDYVCGLRMENPARKKFWLFFSLVSNLGLLAAFKYFNFFMDSFVRFFELDPSDPLRLMLPVGISFYTFQSMSYSIDIYRGELKPIRRFSDYALYVSFFPQLVAGPIERASDLLPQVVSPRVTTLRDVREGLWLILFGLFKKVVIADQMALIVRPAFDSPGAVDGAHMLLACYAFAFQVYGDFSGYSDIARGSAQLMGFQLTLNFRMPFLAANIQEFWQRWHISLSQWIRDYIFYPLMRSGPTTGMVRVNLLITMVVIGVWHGAGLKYMAFGLYHGLLLVLFESTRKLRKRIRPTKPGPAFAAYRLASIVLTFHLCVVAFSIFGCKWLGRWPDMLATLVGRFDLAGLQPAHLMSMGYFLLPLLALQVFQERRGLLPLGMCPLPGRVLIVAWLLVGIAVHGVVDSGTFIYFQF